MITFSIALTLLVCGYFIYGALVERVFAPNYSMQTPANAHPDGVDFIALPTWKVFMIQFLNIAGLGPIFGAIMGAKFGTASYLWIVFGTIFAGAVHDFLAGMISLTNDGESLPEIIGRYLGQKTKSVFGIFTIILMILVAAVFVSGPAGILAQLSAEHWNEIAIMHDAITWILIIFAYYVLATLLPVDKIIGKVYPLFAFALIFMAVGILVMLYVKHPALPEMWESFGVKYESNPIFPMMFISIACGAISGFHATQSPLMARCMTQVKYGRPVFYGAMVTEGIVALIWAAAATCFFSENTDIAATVDGATVAKTISENWLGVFGSILAMLGIVAAPITSGDTALRSARLIVADYIHISQKSISKRLLVSLPIFAATIGLLIYSLSDKAGFGIIWRYFAWSNQTLAVFTLWSITVYLVLSHKNFWITLFPAIFMTAVCTTYLFVAPECFGLWSDTPEYGYIVGVVSAIIATTLFVIWYKSRKR